MVDRKNLMSLLPKCLRAQSIQAKLNHVNIKLLLYKYLYYNFLNELRHVFLRYIIYLFILPKYWENKGQGWAKNYPFLPLYMLCTKRIVVFNNFFSLKCREPRDNLNNLLLIVSAQNLLQISLKYVLQ